MRVRTMLILAVIAAMLLVIAVISNRSERAGERLESGEIFPGLTADAVGEIFLATETDTTRLVEKAGQWRVATEGDYPADTLAVGRMLDKVGLFDRRYLHSTNPEMQATFEVTEGMGTEVKLSAPSGEMLAHFIVGKNGPDFRSQFIRPAESNEVFRIPDYLRSAFDAGRSTWRDKTIFAFDREKVRSIHLRPAEGEPLQIQKTGEDSYVLLPDSGAVKASAIESALLTLSRLNADTFPDSLPSLADAGLDPPMQEVEVKLDDGALYALEIGALNDAETRHYVKRAGDDTLFLLSKGRVNGILPDREKLAEEPLEQSPEEPAEQ